MCEQTLKPWRHIIVLELSLFVCGLVGATLEWQWVTGWQSNLEYNLFRQGQVEARASVYWWPWCVWRFTARHTTSIVCFCNVLSVEMDKENWNSYRNSQQDATVYQNLLFHVYMKLNMFRATHSPSSGAQNCTSGLCRRRCQRPATSTSNNLSRMQNQRLLVQFWAPDDGRCVAQNMLSFI